MPKNFRPLELDFKNCYCAVSFSSGSAVDAVLAGIPNIACDPGNMAWPISSHSLAMIETPYTDATSLWEKQISHCQFSVEELKNGREQIVVTEIPFLVNKSTLLQKIADLVRDKTIDGLSKSIKGKKSSLRP